MSKSVGLIGVPTSMGAFAPGQEKGPEALREADLLRCLSEARVAVFDYGDDDTNCPTNVAQLLPSASLQKPSVVPYVDMEEG